jgi:hypothetical protein
MKRMTGKYSSMFTMLTDLVRTNRVIGPHWAMKKARRVRHQAGLHLT